MSKHKYRKGFREDQVMMSEAYGAMYERRNPDAGTWGRGLKGVLPGAEAGPGFGKEDAEDTGSIEDRFTRAVEYAGDVGEFNVQDFLEFKPYIANWDTLLEIIDEENTEGFSERWEEIKFGRSEGSIETGFEDAEDQEIGLDIKDPAKAYKDLEGGEGKYL